MVLDTFSLSFMFVHRVWGLSGLTVSLQPPLKVYFKMVNKILLILVMD